MKRFSRMCYRIKHKLGFDAPIGMFPGGSNCNIHSHESADLTVDNQVSGVTEVNVEHSLWSSPNKAYCHSTTTHGMGDYVYDCRSECRGKRAYQFGPSPNDRKCITLNPAICRDSNTIRFSTIQI